jgi:hypothetical protein
LVEEELAGCKEEKEREEVYGSKTETTYSFRDTEVGGGMATTEGFIFELFFF